MICRRWGQRSETNRKVSAQRIELISRTGWETSFPVITSAWVSNLYIGTNVNRWVDDLHPRLGGSTSYGAVSSIFHTSPHHPFGSFKFSVLSSQEIFSALSAFATFIISGARSWIDQPRPINLWNSTVIYRIINKMVMLGSYAASHGPWHHGPNE